VPLSCSRSAPRSARSSASPRSAQARTIPPDAAKQGAKTPVTTVDSKQAFAVGGPGPRKLQFFLKMAEVASLSFIRCR
jgi:hypothetical protein